MNKHSKRFLRRTGWVILGLWALPLSSCAVFSWRHRAWEAQVTRNPDGVLEFAVPRDYGDGKNALLLVHGFGDSPQVWEELAPELASRGYRVRAMRLPGWGEPLSAKRELDADAWREAILREAGELAASHDQVAVLAHSMGGCLSTVLAQENLLPVQALVLYAPMLAVSSSRSPLLTTRTWFRIGDALLPGDMVIESLFTDHSRQGRSRPRTRRDPFSPASIFRKVYAEMDRFEAQPPRIGIPLRLVLPGEDRVVDSARARHWFEALQAPEKLLFVDTAAGHVLPLDVDKLAETDRLITWLSEQGIAP